MHFNCTIILKFCTKHGSFTAMLCAKFQNDLVMRNKLWVNSISQEIWDEFQSNILDCHSWLISRLYGTLDSPRCHNHSIYWAFWCGQLHIPRELGQCHTMAIDALDPSVTKPSEAMVLMVKDKFHLAFHKEGFQLPVPPQCWGNTKLKWVTDSRQNKSKYIPISLYKKL